MILIFIAILFGIGYQYLDPIAPKSVSIITGEKDGVYYKTALKYQELLKDEGVTLNIIPSDGSIAALKMLEKNKADMAFIQGGTTSDYQHLSLYSLASLYFEPLWIFYRTELGNVMYISQLVGKRLAIGKEESGTYRLSIEILNMNGVTADNTTFLHLSNEEAKNAILAGEIDAVFNVSGAYTSLIKELFYDSNVHLMSFKRAHAYDKRFPYISKVDIAEGMVNVRDNIPSEEISMIATVATLLAKEDLHPDIVRLILQAAKKVHSKGGVFEDEGAFPSSRYTDIEMSPEADIYLKEGDGWLDRIFPFWIASQIKRLMILVIPLLILFIPLIKGAMPLYRWQIRHKIYGRYEKLHDINKRLSTMNMDETEKEIIDLKEILEGIKQNTDVPLSYMNEYYDLQLHMNLVIQNLQEHKTALARNMKTGN
ncbi:MAG: TAXI family TRAP transporter solute-binding subunit [Campylobacterota bacterium]|nr:TAXI family TRAP transporter solute-binding subunit [Campylobacterota bacterium]